MSCKHPRLIAYGDQSADYLSQVDCGNWRVCEHCRAKRDKYLRARSYFEVEAIRSALAGCRGTSLLITLTLDRRLGARYGTAARQRLGAGRNRWLTGFRRWCKRYGHTIVGQMAAYELHKDGALHCHMAVVLRGSVPLPETMLNKLGHTDIGAAASRGWGSYGEGMCDVSIKYLSDSETAIGAVGYCMKYVRKSMSEDWDIASNLARVNEAVESGRDLCQVDKMAYKGMRIIEFGRSFLLRGNRIAAGWRPPVRSGRYTSIPLPRGVKVGNTVILSHGQAMDFEKRSSYMINPVLVRRPDGGIDYVRRSKLSSYLHVREHCDFT